MHVAGRHPDLLRVGAVVGQAQDAKLRALGDAVVAPVEARIDDHRAAGQRRIGARADRGHLSRAVRAQDDALAEPSRVRAGAAANPHVTMIEGGGAEPDHDLARAGRGIVHVLQPQVLGRARLAQNRRPHRSYAS